ncbi:hypothetical protein GUJ93_ZPchr0001g32859 [Zizania palustris]|uniref:Uncharacterized protein n=1 Tax=Zizania palustris TaxID=103762 RepID=A0A8J5V052_ZIZPA|nr:hypothetical protein GUJ93_ZPchr0001g32859 [Zizania palustris]
MVLDEPLDFEEEDPLIPHTRLVKRKKVIGLDDLLVDFFETGKDELKAAGVKSKHGPKGYNSDDEDKKVMEKEIKFCKFVDEYEEQSKEFDAGDGVPQWGMRVFGWQKSPSIHSDAGVENCKLLQSFCASEHLGFDLDIEQG